ncbi:DedA family protein [bacterium]|nr:DedA family protein [bacterium]
MITEKVAEFAVDYLGKAGYPASGVLMALESMIAPIPSEAVMPFVGFLVADGKWNLWLAVTATTAGSLSGSLLSYLMGRYGGKPLVLRVGKYLLLDRHDLEITERFFGKRRGLFTLFISRFIPVIRHFISIPAGTGRMPVLPFAAVTLAGATLWNGFLLALGYKLRENWGLVQKYSHQVDLVVLFIILIVMIGFIYSRISRLRKKTVQVHPAEQEQGGNRN